MRYGRVAVAATHDGNANADEGTVAMVFGMSVYEACAYFLLYAFLGWVVEVAYHAVAVGKVVNRGFLNGPLCPVYGFGMLAVIAMGNAVSARGGVAAPETTPVWLLFLGGMALATAIELVAGWLLDKLFHTRWWDYSDKPLNLHGYICLEFSLIWGIAIVLVVRELHPLVGQLTTHVIPERVGWPVMGVLYAVLLVDVVVSVATAHGMDRRLHELDRLRAAMLVPSDAMSKVIATGTMRTAQHAQEQRLQMTLAADELRDRADRDRDEIVEKVDGVREHLEEKADASREAVRDLRDAEEERARARAAGADLAEAQRAYRRRYHELMDSLAAHRVAGSGRLVAAFPHMKRDGDVRFGGADGILQELRAQLERRARPDATGRPETGDRADS